MADVDSETECFKVNPVQPALDTEAVDENGDPITTALPFGSTIYDQATLTGTANQPGDPVIEPTTAGGEAEGTITFKLYGPLDPDNLETSCDTLAAGFPAAGIVVDVSGDSPPAYGGAGSTPPVSFVPQGPGVYHWKAVYSGDLPNTLGDDHNADCDDSAESVTIQQLQPTMDTAQSFVPNDSATITVDAGAGDLEGSVVFQLFVDDPECDGTAAYTSDPIDVSDTDDPGDTSLSDTVESANETSYNVSGTTFHWVVAFTSDNPAHLDVTSGCGNETSSITIDNGDTQPPAGP